MLVEELLLAVGGALAVIALCLLALPAVFAGRVLPGVWLEGTPLGGVALGDLPGVLQEYEKQLTGRRVALRVRDHQVEQQLGELGVSLDLARTVQAAQASSLWARRAGHFQVRPRVLVDSMQLEKFTGLAFASAIETPRNATLLLTSSPRLRLGPSTPGEGIERVTFEEELIMRAEHGDWQRPIELKVVTKPAEVQDHEVTAAQTYGEQLLGHGLELTFAASSWHMTPATVRRLLAFVEVPDPGRPSNHILGVQFKPAELASYLETTVAPDITQTAQDARFALDADGRVTQFATPRRGQELALTDTVQQMNEHLARQFSGQARQFSGQARQPTSVPLVVLLTEPLIDSVEDITALGITTRLTAGESDFAGSPRNRRHNIAVGTARYHGLLIPPGQEFSFNEHLGPVTGAAGYKPELVIKHNVTTPEFGGGLCQVSTTMFRAAVQAGLKITARRSHAYAVRYYGVPGFDATIYPPYTDLRFINNTPGYLLIQARIEGDRLSFELWGTPDGRRVAVEGPHPYGRQPNGAVKATLTQRVTKDGVVTLEDKFYSRYKSPDLFPKVVATDEGRT